MEHEWQAIVAFNVPDEVAEKVLAGEPVDMTLAEGDVRYGPKVGCWRCEQMLVKGASLECPGGRDGE